MGNRNDGKTGKNTDIQTDVALINAHAQVDAANIAASTQLKVAKKGIEAQWINADAQKTSATVSANAQVKAAQIKNDPATLDANEAVAYELIKKTGILSDLSAFEVKLAVGDKEAMRDAKNLEIALKKDRKDLTVDGKITDKTIAAARGLIGENSEAILKYEEVMNKMPVKVPSAAGTKTQPKEIEH